MTNTRKTARLLQPMHVTTVHTEKPDFYTQHWKSNSDGKWYFHVKARNHMVVLPSQGYKTKKAALSIIDRLHFGGTNYVPSVEITDPKAVKQLR